MPTYLLCTTPRTGSTLLADWLESTGVAGAPREYFIPEFIDGMHKVLTFSSLREYATALGDLCEQAYGAYAVKLMWNTFTSLRMQLAPELPIRAFIEQFWPNAHFVHLTRADKVAQAVSLCRAERTNLWHRLDSGLEVRGDASRYGGEGCGHFDIEQALSCYQRIVEADRGWWGLFRAAEIEPLQVEYERMLADPELAVRAVLRFVGVPQPEQLQLVSERVKLADTLSERWTMELRGRLKDAETLNSAMRK